MWCQNAATRHSSVTCWFSFIARDLTHTQHTVSRKEYISGDRPPPTNNFETWVTSLTNCQDAKQMSKLGGMNTERHAKRKPKSTRTECWKRQARNEREEDAREGPETKVERRKERTQDECRKERPRHEGCRGRETKDEITWTEYWKEQMRRESRRELQQVPKGRETKGEKDRRPKRAGGKRNLKRT